jgi:hypothetical protein
VVSWQVDFDPAVWLPVPETDDEADLEHWVERAADAVVNDFRAEFQLAPDYPQLIRVQLRILGELAQRKSQQGWLTLAHLPGPGWDPFPVYVTFQEPRAESPDYLLDLAGARGLPAVQPPTVEYVTVDDLGEGVRVTRYEEPEGFPLTETICYAWRARDTDVLVLAQSDDLPRLAEVGDDLAALTRAIRSVPEASGV